MVAIGNQWFWTYEVTKVLKLVRKTTSTIDKDIMLNNSPMKFNVPGKLVAMNFLILHLLVNGVPKK